MPECAYTNRILNMPWFLNMPKFWICLSSEYGRLFNMRALHSVLIMQENALKEVWIYLRFYIWQDSEYSKVRTACKSRTGLETCKNMTE